MREEVLMMMSYEKKKRDFFSFCFRGNWKVFQYQKTHTGKEEGGEMEKVVDGFLERWRMQKEGGGGRGSSTAAAAAAVAAAAVTFMLRHTKQGQTNVPRPAPRDHDS